MEWYNLIYKEGLTSQHEFIRHHVITRWWDLHASHVIVGMGCSCMLVMAVSLAGFPIKTPNAARDVPFLVLAFCGCHLGGCFYRGLHNRQVDEEKMAVELYHGEAGEKTQETHIPMPAGSYWPMVFAFGVTLLAAGLVTHWVVSAVGLVMGVARGFRLVGQCDSA